MLLFFLLFNLAFRAPIFTDEISWKILHARYFLDNHISITLQPQCRETFSAHQPSIFLPFSYFESFFYSDLSHLLKLRLGSFLYLILALYLFYVLTQLTFKKSPNWNSPKNLLWVVCASSLGISPFYMVLNRPELPILIFLLSISYVYLKLKEQPSLSSFTTLWLKTLFLICVLGILFYHPKGLFFTPVFLWVGFDIFQKPISKLITLITILFITIQQFSFVSYQVACPLDEKIQQGLSQLVVTKIDSLKGALSTVLQLAHNLISTGELFKAVAFSGTTYGYFPTLGVQGLIQDPILAYIYRIWNYSFYIFVGILIWNMIRTLKDSFTLFSKKSIPSPRARLFTALLFSWLALCSFTTRKPIYDNTLLMPLFFLCSMLTMSIPSQTSSFFLKQKFFYFFMTVLFFSSSIIFLSSYTQFKSEFEKGGQIESALFGVSAFNFDVVQRRVQSLALKCGIDKNALNSHLVVDELSYPSFGKFTRQPYFALFLFWIDSIARDRGIEKFLKARDSAGFIGSCRYLPEDLLKRARRDQELCCLPSFN